MKLIRFPSSESSTLVKTVSFVLGLSTERSRRIVKDGDTRVDGIKVREDCEIAVGQEIRIYLSEELYERAAKIIYSDDNVIAVNKPQGIESAGAFSMEERLSALFERQVYACHRLDMNTKGVNLFALNIEARDQLFLAFKERRVHKEYVCEVFGKPEKSQLLSDYLVKDSERGLCRVVSKKERGAVEIITKYELIGQSYISCEKKTLDLKKSKTEEIRLSRLLVSPLTGRTHQIRAQLAYKGLPIVGDCKYGDFRLNKILGETRQRLTCVSIAAEFHEGSRLFYLSGKKFSCQFD